MSIQPDTVKLFDIWDSGDAVDRHLLDVLSGPDALVIAIGEAQNGQRVHQGIATYTGDLHIPWSDFMLQGCSPVNDIVAGSIDLGALCTGDVIDQVQVLGTVCVAGTIGTKLSRNIFHGNVTIAADTAVTSCQFRDGAALLTENNGTFDFASGRATHSVHALLGLDGTETDIVTGWHNGLDHLDLADADLSVLSVDHFRRETVFHLSNGGTVDILARNAML